MKFLQIKLLKGQRDFIADKLMDTANYALAGLVFNALFEKKLSVLVLFGVILYILGWKISIRMKK